MRPSPPTLTRRWDVYLVRTPSLWQRITAPQLFVGSFALLVLLGTLGLKTLPGLYTGEPLGWLDALFTATSAACVTGLTVVDTATYFTPRGQAFILLLIQLGGLGVISFTSLIIVALGRRLSLRHQALSTGGLDAAPQIDPRRLIRDVVLFTFGFELVGAVLLYLFWIPRLGWREAAWPALFHSVSAFCNAGFSTFSDNLVGAQREPVNLVVLMLLIVAGGLGFLTLEELYLRFRAGRARRIFRLSLHSRIVLTTTAVLLAVGWLLFGVLEWDDTLAELPIGHRVVNALFMSVTCRTAGFNTIDYGRASEGANFLTILLMMVGGSPGSTAGGIKTTTFALLGLVAWSRFRGQEVTSFWSRSVREETVERAVGLFVVAFGLVTICIFVLTVTETHGRFLDHMFEAVSAFNTVGLSTGLTPNLTPAGKGVAILLMFLGRVGPLTFAAALAVRRRGGPLRYAYEDVVVG
ncbi:MAG TPA: TrkH family potassium uptake protein [Gemmataceae bacterium]|nr:TrkH family potassium uptake protein [Gemmataceae bacterium]